MSDSDRIERNYLIRYRTAEHTVDQLSDLVVNLDRDIQYYRMLIDTHETRRGAIYEEVMKILEILTKNRDVTENLRSRKERELANLRKIAERRVQIMNTQGGINPLSDITSKVEFNK